MSDLQDSHRQHSVECFNRVWALLDQAERTAEEDQLMCEMAHASLFHWLRRDDKTAGNESIGLWLLARVYAVLDRPVEAMRYARRCLEVSEVGELEAFYVGYAYEACARAAKVQGDVAVHQEMLEKSNNCLEKVEDSQSR
jgi:hypothetical protein